MIETLSAWLSLWGLGLIFAFNMLGRCGIPLPSTVLMIVAGALIVEDQADLMRAVALAYLSALAGDVLAYRIGRAGGCWLETLSARSAKAAALLTRARALAQQHGAMAVLLTRWPLSTVGPYLNLVAGAIGLPWRLFMAFCVVGELIWVSLYLTLGYLARDQLSQAIDGASRATMIGGAAVLAVALGAWLITRRLPKRR